MVVKTCHKERSLVNKAQLIQVAERKRLFLAIVWQGFGFFRCGSGP